MNKKDESGQAIMELLISLIALLACVLGLIFVSGISLGNIELLLDSRSDADSQAYNAYSGFDGNEIGDWSYSLYEDEDRNIMKSIPFLINDVASTQGNNLELFNGTINNSTYSSGSENSEDSSSYYIFNDFTSMPNNQSSFAAIPLTSAYLTANLLEGDGSISSSVITLEQVENRDELFRAIEILSSGTIDVDKIKNALSNKVYMPAMKID